jgi:hypothetical protein
MTIIDPALLKGFSGPGKCEHCLVFDHRAPHHVHTRGAGRLDVRINLVSLCVLCHRKVHDGNIKRAALLAIVSKREGVPVDVIVQTLWDLRRQPKEEAK